MKIGCIRVSTAEHNTRQEELITAVEAIRRLDMEPSTFYRKVKQASK